MIQPKFDMDRKENYIELFKFYLLQQSSGYEEGASTTLPEELYEIFYRLYEEPNSLPNLNLYTNFAKIMRQIIYDPIAIKPGRDMIKEHIWQLVGIGKISENSRIFEENFEKAFGLKVNLSEDNKISIV